MIKRPSITNGKIKFFNDEIVFKKIGYEITEDEIKEKFCDNFENFIFFLKDKFEIEKNEKIKVVKINGSIIESFKNLLKEKLIVVLKNNEEE
jgi:hypothetical protein